MHSILGMPMLVLIGMLVVTFLIGLVAEWIYRADVNLYYGEEIRKLKALISEMQALKTWSRSATA